MLLRIFSLAASLFETLIDRFELLRSRSTRHALRALRYFGELFLPFLRPCRDAIGESFHLILVIASIWRMPAPEVRPMVE